MYSKRLTRLGNKQTSVLQNNQRNKIESTLKTEQSHDNVFDKQLRVFEETMWYKATPMVVMKSIGNFKFPRRFRSNWSGGGTIHSLARSTSTTRTGSCRSFRRVHRLQILRYRTLDAVNPNTRTMEVANMIIRRCAPTEYPVCDIVFSGLHSGVAGDVEMAFSQRKLCRLYKSQKLVTDISGPADHSGGQFKTY